MGPTLGLRGRAHGGLPLRPTPRDKPTAPSLVQEVLKHLQGKLEQEARVMVSSGQTEVLDQLKGGCPGRVGCRHPG